MQALKKEAAKEFTQFEITTDLLRNLYKYDLTPVTKLVLLELTTHLNEPRNGFVVFPSVGYIAEVLGIGLTAAKKAINDLIKQGLIIKTKRNNVKGNYNKYSFTSKITGLKNGGMNILSQQGIKMRNSTSERSENEFFKQSDSDLFLLKTNNKEKINNKEVFLNKGGNVYWASEQSARAERRHVYCERSLTGDDEILEDYAIKHGARNVKAYINTLKSTKSAEKIIKEYKSKAYNPHIAFKKTDLLREKRETEKQESVSFETSAAWLEFGKKHGIKK